MQCWVAESWRIRAREKPRGTTFNVHKPLLRQIMKNAPPDVCGKLHSFKTPLQPIIHCQPTLPTVNVIHIQDVSWTSPCSHVQETPHVPSSQVQKPSSSTHPSTPPRPPGSVRAHPSPSEHPGAFLLFCFDLFWRDGVRDRGFHS